MLSVPELADALQTVFTTTAEQAARETKCVIRERKFTGPSLCQTLVFGWLADPEAALSDLVQAAAVAGVAVSRQAIEQRFTERCAAMLKQVLAAAVAQVLTADPVAIPLLQRFAGVYLRDCTVIGLPDALASTWHGCGGRGDTSGAALKASVQLNLLDGALDGPLLAAGKVHDRVVGEGHAPVPAGALEITDLGYFGLERLAAVDEAGVYYLLRARADVQARRADAPTGRSWEIPALLASQQETTVDLPILLGASKRLPCRLLAVRAPESVVNERRRKLRKAAKERGRTPAAPSLAMAAWTVLVTNVPTEQLTIPEAWALARARWQIELLFKVWKTHGKLAVSCSDQAYRVLCELYAKLLGMVVQHWVLLTTCWAFPDRSLIQAAAAVQEAARALGRALRKGRGLHTLLCDLRDELRTTCRIPPRSTRVPAYQLLLHAASGGQT
jgi:hypothetical protein